MTTLPRLLSISTVPTLSDLTYSQRDRLAYIEVRAEFIGEVRRSDLVSRFGIQTAAATRDLAEYRAIAGRNLEYRSDIKAYVCSELFRPVFDMPVERILHWLAIGYGEVGGPAARPPIPSAGTALATQVRRDVLSAVTRAITSRQAVQVSYRGMSSGLTTREIVPFAIADSGLRWHVRAFDRRSADFRDFILGRLDDARVLAGATGEHEHPDQDIQWSRVTELELVPHPANVQHPDTIEAEYGMVNGVLQVRARAAMTGYLLRRWNVDCTKDHSLRGGEYHLWLRNRQALYGVTNLVLAPGYEPSA
jgi:hypothetical protein